MEYRSSLKRRSRRCFTAEDRWQEWGWGLGLLLAALLLFGVNLDFAPLQPMEVALDHSAKAIAASPHSPLAWLLAPFGEQFSVEKPPLLPVAIAFVYRWCGTDPAVTRWPVAGLGALSVFFLYRTGREIFPRRRMAILAAAIYLVLSPLIPLGRFALPTVASSGLTIGTMWLTLRSRRDFRWTIGIGWGLSLLFLTQGGLAIIAGGIILGFLVWDTPRLLRSLYLWTGIILGSFPAIGWMLVATPSTLFSQPDRSSLVLSLSYGLKISCFALPGLFIGVAGLFLAIPHCNWGWAKLALIWFFGAAIAIPLLSFSIESSLLIFPPLALAGGVKLNELLDLPGDRYSLSGWSQLAIALAFAAIICSLGFAWYFPLDRPSLLVFTAVALCLAMVALAVSQRDRQSLIVLFWGMYVALFLFIGMLPEGKLGSPAILQNAEILSAIAVAKE